MKTNWIKNTLNYLLKKRYDLFPSLMAKPAYAYAHDSYEKRNSESFMSMNEIKSKIPKSFRNHLASYDSLKALYEKNSRPDGITQKSVFNGNQSENMHYTASADLSLLYSHIQLLQDELNRKNVYNNLLKKINDTVHYLFSITDKKVLLKALTQTLCEELGFSSAILWIYDKSKHELIPISWSNVRIERLDKLNISETIRPYKDLLFNQKSFFIMDDLDDKQSLSSNPLLHIHQIRHALESNAIFLYPIIGIDNIEDMLENLNGKISTTAILMVGCNHRLNNLESKELLSYFSNSAGLILGNIDVYKYLHSNYQSFKQQAITDGLTGLYNRRYFNQELERELQRSYRHFLNMSLVMIDVDHFKHYNDTNGHMAGDEALKKLASILKSCTRICDLECRYGGEELVLILPETNKQQAMVFAEKLRFAVEKADFPNQQSQPSGNFTISLGVASFPEDAVSMDDLIKKADSALYSSKTTGRNKVVPYYSQLTELA